ncbi:hypothetical protein [Curtobacterium herbarum]|uniref:Uncharacterized protein n=1 Tax=Curtobacterium herbarum TaxID=150122 RepID=A0ABP4KBB9_9MICO|nr:hypothetical protein [Curtobacterium herbarum]MBM7474833.1 hypothetical protein [Curtobacterium herbarum]MCS6545481.1 hypothetical protein [Curtobacterium herbarum]
METTTEYTVLEHHRCTAVELVDAALRAHGHRVVSADGLLAVASGNRLATALLGALVRPAQQYRRYEVALSATPGHAVLTLRHADHGAAVVGGMIGANRRREAWHRVASLVETTLHGGGILLHRTDRIDTSGITLR